MRNQRTYPTKYYISFITFIVFSIFILFYRIKKKLPADVKTLKAPYLILSNHVGYWDPFIVGHFLPKFTHFVSSDAAFRNKLVSFFLTRLGTIPKKKNIRDTKVIRDIASVINQGENVGIFPEAVRNWSGLSFRLDGSIVKLIRFINVPVVVAVLKGMNLFNPRWSAKLRRTKVEVEYKLLINREQLITLSDHEIFEKLNKYICHDEVEYQRINLNKIYSKHKAENINHAIYICPECFSIDSFETKGDKFWCNVCDYMLRIDNYGFFERNSNFRLHFDNIRDWYIWEEKWLMEHVKIIYENNDDKLIFKDIESKIYHSKSNKSLNFIGLADVKLYIDRIELEFKDKDHLITLNYYDLQTINPQVNDRLEIYYNGEAYRIIGSRKGVSALKWEVALNVIWEKMGLSNKLSPYIPQNIDN